MMSLQFHRHMMRACVLSACLTIAGSPMVMAESLADALVKAYQTSPTLAASRAQLRALDENVPQALASRRPQVSLNGSASSTYRFYEDDAQQERIDSMEAKVQADLLLYDNGQTAAAIEAARNAIAAGRANLKLTEQNVLFAAIQAYADVLRNQEFVSLARKDVERLEETLRATRNRFDVGEVTRTDVSLSEASLASSRSDLASALGALEISREAYRAAIGNYPVNLQQWPPRPDLPNSLDNAMTISYSKNPFIIAAQFNERIAAANLQRAAAARGPSVNARAELGGALSNAGQNSLQGQPFGRVSVTGALPLYTGGQRASLIRQAEQVLDQRRFEVQQAGRQVSEQISAAWSQLQAARVTLRARREQAEASRIAANGVREEARLGARSTLDVLDANQERLEAEAQVVQSVRDEYVATYSLLQSMGLLTVDHLDLGIEPYDPELNFTEIAGSRSKNPVSEAFDRIRSRWSQN